MTSLCSRCARANTSSDQPTHCTLSAARATAEVNVTSSTAITAEIRVIARAPCSVRIILLRGPHFHPYDSDTAGGLTPTPPAVLMPRIPVSPTLRRNLLASLALALL